MSSPLSDSLTNYCFYYIIPIIAVTDFVGDIRQDEEMVSPIFFSGASA